MKCTVCGQENNDKNRICVFCHAKLKRTSRVELIDEEEDVPISPGHDPSLQSHTHNYLILIVMLCMVIGIAGWYYLKERQKREPEIISQETTDTEPIQENSFSEYSVSSVSSEESSEAREESSSESGKEGSVESDSCNHKNIISLDEYNHRCTGCGLTEEHIWYVENDAVYCRLCHELKEYIVQEDPNPETGEYKLFTVIITGNYLNIRSGPGENYPLLTDESLYYRHQYATIYEISYDDMWGRVRWNGMDGWIYLYYTNGLNEMDRN